MIASENRGNWGSRLGFILAAAGSAVGLGNIWKFPYGDGANGGGAFVLFYLFCVALIGLPIMMAEILIGRNGRMSPVFSIAKATEQSGAGRAWLGIGVGLLVVIVGAAAFQILVAVG
jgi:NSS family neurotransmitter:Na+ symporter